MSERPLPDDSDSPGAPSLESDEQASAFLAALVDSFDGAIVGKTLDGIIRTWNPGAERVFGYTAEEVVGRSITLLLPPERQSEEKLILARLRRGERIENYETVRVTKDGRRIDVALTVSPIRDGSGALVGASKIARDITGVKEAKRSLRDSEERFRTLADHIAQLAWMAQPDGGVFWYNRRWFDYTGTTFEEMQGWGWQAVHHPDHVDAVTDKFRRALEAGETWEDTFPLRGASGEYRWFLSRALPIRDDSGEIVRWFGTNTDITERMEMEERLRADDRRKDQFLATLAHELRNPLAPIVHSVELLRLGEGSEGVQARALATLDRQTRHLVRLVDDLLDISRITRGIVALRPEAVDLQTVLHDAIEASRPAIDAEGHQLLTELPGAPIPLKADATRLVQVFTNLLHNAAKYTPTEGEIELRTERDDDTVTVVVADSGPGIPKEMRDRVFELFVQGDSGRRGGASGLGIGLTLVRALVELHGGSVRARERRSGPGVAMEVRLPVEATPETAEEVASNRGASPGLRVLVVDDNRDAADSLGLLIEAQGHRPRTVYDGEAALEVGEAFRPHLVLLDLGMPGMDGLETARRLRRHPWGREACLAALTGWGQASDRERTREAGFDRHLVKPIEARHLAALLAELSEVG